MPNSEKALDPHMNSDHSCPMCGTEKTSPKGKVKEYSYQTCTYCELVWSPDITSDYLSKLYAMCFNEPQDGAPKKGWCRHIDFLDPAFDLLFKDKPFKILDFGTGQNEIPGELRKEGHRVIA